MLYVRYKQFCFENHFRTMKKWFGSSTLAVPHARCDFCSCHVQASLRSESLGMKPLVKLSVMDVEHLGFSSEAFDTVVDTFSLCVFSDPVGILLLCQYHPHCYLHVSPKTSLKCRPMGTLLHAYL